MESGLKKKYIVHKADTGEPVDSCFVLRPESDPAAVAAIRAYADAAENRTLANDLLNWVGARKNYPLTISELEEILVDDSKSGHIWIWDMESRFSIPGIVDKHRDFGICGVYGAGELEYTEKNYGKTWLAYLKEPYADRNPA